MLLVIFRNFPNSSSSKSSLGAVLGAGTAWVFFFFLSSYSESEDRDSRSDSAFYTMGSFFIAELAFLVISGFGSGFLGDTFTDEALEEGLFLGLSIPAL